MRSGFHQGRFRGRTLRRLGLVAGIVVACSAPTKGGAALDPALQSSARQAIKRGLAFLAASQQRDGGWMLFGRTDPAITSLVAKCFAQGPAYGPQNAIVRRAMSFVLTFQKEDGGIYVEDAGLRSYYTSVALMALSAMNDERYSTPVKRAQQFLIERQWDEEDGHGPESTWYGGVGYGKHKRPDLSNTQMMLEALKQSGVPATHPAFQKAVTFVSRCQMSSHGNDREFARGDGGFIYTPVKGGESKAGVEIVDGRPRLRSYGSMTYAGFKSLLYAGLARDDPRVQQAHGWIRSHYTLDHNPNMPDRQAQEGLYYFYHVFARALAAWGEDSIIDVDGRTHNWREDLCRKLLSVQSSDGSWVNQADRWYEDNPYLVTSYAVLALQTALD